MTVADLTPATVHLLAEGEIERRWGPPGTGKSSSLKQTIAELVAELGPDSVAVTSFTVTAAKSIAAMDLPLPDRQVGTLHSLAYRALDHPDVALDPKVVKDWNTRVGYEWRITPDARRASPDSVEAGAGGDSGDELLSSYDMARARLIPHDAMPADVRRFAAAWEGWKRDANCIDYSDMIHLALQQALEGQKAPGNPRVLIGDEAQDLTAAEIALMLAWRAPKTIFALDDDQAINAWRGGDASPILALGTGMDGEPQDIDLTDTQLRQSYRIPASVHTIAQTWIEHCSHRRDKEYRPRDYDGQAYTVSHPLESMATAKAIERDAHAGRSVMAIASCEYMLRQLITNLRRLGVPFANRYRPAESRWNPLRTAAGMTSAERLYRYLVCDERLLGARSRLWTGDDVRAWLGLVGVKEAGLARGAKTKANVLPSGELDVAQVMALFGDEETFYDASEPSLDWLLKAARGLSGMVGTADRPGKLDYPAAVARSHGPGALVDEPLVTVGTIHSTKGAEAECSPPDEPVLTHNRGWVPIGDLDPSVDTLISYDTEHRRIRRGGPRRRDGYRFRIGVRPYQGELITMKTDHSLTRITPNHHLTAQWNERAKSAWLTYVMRRGDWWRIGTTKFYRESTGGRYLGLPMRCSRERADQAWILNMYDDWEDAIVAERTLSLRYGVPEMPFVAAANRGLTQSALTRIWDGIHTESRAKELLADHGQLPDQAVFHRGRHAGLRSQFIVQAAGFLPHWMELPIDTGGATPMWSAVTMTKETYTGPVYSLDVEDLHHYVSGGTIVHNCVYLSPSLSPAGWAEWNRGPSARDSVIRQFYVGLTRARSTCVVLGSTEKCVSPSLLCPPEMSVR